jgi:hypothetical protein
MQQAALLMPPAGQQIRLRERQVLLGRAPRTQQQMQQTVLLMQLQGHQMLLQILLTQLGSAPRMQQLLLLSV